MSASAAQLLVTEATQVSKLVHMTYQVNFPCSSSRSSSLIFDSTQMSQSKRFRFSVSRGHSSTSWSNVSLDDCQVRGHLQVYHAFVPENSSSDTAEAAAGPSAVDRQNSAAEAAPPDEPGWEMVDSQEEGAAGAGAGEEGE